MIRTQVYIPEDLYRELKLLASMEKKNFSQLIREGVRMVLNKKIKRAGKFGKGFIGTVKTEIKTDAVKDIRDYYKSFK